MCIVSLCSPLILASVFASEEVALDKPNNLEQVYVEYPEFEPSVAQLESVRVVGPQEMTYCSLITKMNLQRFTWLPTTTTLWEEQAILQWDAIRLIELWLSEDVFLPIDRLSKDMDTYFPERLPYTLFDMYIYTPAPDEFITEKQYLFQWHRVVLLSVDDHRRVMDPLRWTTSSWQSREEYKQYIDTTAYTFVYNQEYAFEDTYEFDFVQDDLTKSEREVEDLTSMIYKGIVIPEIDATFMPVAAKFLSTITLFSTHFSISFPSWVSIKTDDGSPFNIWLLTTRLWTEKDKISIDVSLAGKGLLFSDPVKIRFSKWALSSKDAWNSYLVKKETDSLPNAWCIDEFDVQWERIITSVTNDVEFSICHAWTYIIVATPEKEGI